MAITDKRKLYNKQYKDEYTQRTKRVSITISLAEYSELEKRAKEEGVKQTTLIKNMALAYHQQNQAVPETIKNELRELRFLLLNVANNINQIAHHSNTVRQLADENGLLLEIQRLEQIVNNYVAQRLKQWLLNPWAESTQALTNS